VTCSLLRPGALLLAAALLTAGCSAGSTASPGAAQGSPDAPLRIGLTAEPANLDFTRTDGAAIPEALLVNVYEGLVALNQETGEIEPALAESWTVSPDGLVYDFTLREGVTFSNRQPFTADDVKFSIERVKSDAWTVSLKSAMSVVSGVEVVSPTHARVTLAQPSNSWLFRMTTRIGAMFDPSGPARTRCRSSAAATGSCSPAATTTGVRPRRSARSTSSTSATPPRPSTPCSPTAST
jgi:peptide/nickel transport system substrate-binding protein